MIDFLGKMSAVVFENEFLRKQFKEFYQDIIPNLNFCRSCGILKCRKCILYRNECRMCQLMKCDKCQLFKTTRDILFNKCPFEQWKYIANFIRDFFDHSDYSFLKLQDLTPISKVVKEKNRLYIEMHTECVNDFI